MKYNEISNRCDVPVNTLKSWRTRYHWKQVHPQPKRCTKNRKRDAAKIVDELEANNDLTEKQKLFASFICNDLMQRGRI